MCTLVRSKVLKIANETKWNSISVSNDQVHYHLTRRRLVHCDHDSSMDDSKHLKGLGLYRFDFKQNRYIEPKYWYCMDPVLNQLCDSHYLYFTSEHRRYWNKPCSIIIGNESKQSYDIEQNGSITIVTYYDDEQSNKFQLLHFDKQGYTYYDLMDNLQKNILSELNLRSQFIKVNDIQNVKPNEVIILLQSEENNWNGKNIELLIVSLDVSMIENAKFKLLTTIMDNDNNNNWYISSRLARQQIICTYSGKHTYLMQTYRAEGCDDIVTECIVMEINDDGKLSQPLQITCDGVQINQGELAKHGASLSLLSRITPLPSHTRNVFVIDEPSTHSIYQMIITGNNKLIFDQIESEMKVNKYQETLKDFWSWGGHKLTSHNLMHRNQLNKVETELLIIGWSKQLWKLPNMSKIRFPPVYLFRIIGEYYSNDMIVIFILTRYLFNVQDETINTMEEFYRQNVLCYSITNLKDYI